MRPSVIAVIAFWCMMIVSGVGPDDRSDRDGAVGIGDVPASVRRMIREHARGGEVIEIERSSDGGRLTFDVVVRVDGEEVEFEVGPDGTFLGMDEADGDGEDQYGDDEGDEDGGDEERVERIGIEGTPAIVLGGFVRATGGGGIGGIERVIDDGVRTYEVEFERDGREGSVVLSEEGELIEIEESVGWGGLPEAVRRALRAEFPGAEIGDVDAVRVSYYEVEVEVNGVVREIAVLATGEIEDDLGEDDEGEDD